MTIGILALQNIMTPCDSAFNLVTLHACTMPAAPAPTSRAGRGIVAGVMAAIISHPDTLWFKVQGDTGCGLWGVGCGVWGVDLWCVARDV